MLLLCATAARLGGSASADDGCVQYSKAQASHPPAFKPGCRTCAEELRCATSAPRAEAPLRACRLAAEGVPRPSARPVCRGHARACCRVPHTAAAAAVHAAVAARCCWLGGSGPGGCSPRSPRELASAAFSASAGSLRRSSPLLPSALRPRRADLSLLARVRTTPWRGHTAPGQSRSTRYWSPPPRHSPPPPWRPCVCSAAASLPPFLHLLCPPSPPHHAPPRHPRAAPAAAAQVIGTGAPPAVQTLLDETKAGVRSIAVALTVMPAYAGKSFEELRLEDYYKHKGINQPAVPAGVGAPVAPAAGACARVCRGACSGSAGAAHPSSVGAARRSRGVAQSAVFGGDCWRAAACGAVAQRGHSWRARGSRDCVITPHSTTPRSCVVCVALDSSHDLPLSPSVCSQPVCARACSRQPLRCTRARKPLRRT